MHIYKQILLYILNENTIWPSGAIARDIVSQEKNTMCSKTITIRVHSDIAASKLPSTTVEYWSTPQFFGASSAGAALENPYAPKYTLNNFYFPPKFLSLRKMYCGCVISQKKSFAMKFKKLIGYIE